MSSPEVNTQNGPLLSRPVVYRPADYIGGFRHLLIFAVDSCVILIIAAPIGSLFPLLGIIFAWCYLAVLKPSRIRSPGYWIADAKIITLDGGRPSPFRMTLRLMWMAMWALGWPISFFVDWLWTSIDHERQMLRDLFSETRLVRNNATPIGTGRISYVLYTGIGLTVLYARVRSKDPVRSLPPVSPFIEMPTTLPDKVADSTAAIWPHDGSIVQCPQCSMRVIPKSNGLCPSCQTQLVS